MNISEDLWKHTIGYIFRQCWLRLQETYDCKETFNLANQKSKVKLEVLPGLLTIGLKINFAVNALPTSLYIATFFGFRGFAISSINRTNLYLLTVNSNCGECKQSKPDDLPGIPGKYKENILFYANVIDVSHTKAATRNIFTNSSGKQVQARNRFYNK